MLNTINNLVLSPSNSFKFVTTPFQHQKESLDYSANNKCFLLGDEQGLGKTKQSIDIAMYRKQQEGFKHCLIICGINSSKRNWVNEVNTHSKEEALILGTRVGSMGKIYIGGSTQNRIEDLELVAQGEIDEFFLITNAETLRNKIVQTYIKHLTESGMIGMVIFDEIHKVKNALSQQGRSIHCLQSKYKLALTGTPIMNNPLDLYNLLFWMNAYKESYNVFRHRFCETGGLTGEQIVGYRNLKDLRKIVSKVMLRRKKEEVLDLPEKIRSIEYVQMSTKQKKIYNDIKRQIKDDLQRIKVSANPLAQLVRLRQATCYTGLLSDTIKESAKLDRLKEMLEEIILNGKKAIIFSNFSKVVDFLVDEFNHLNPAIAVGKTKDVNAEIDKFQNDESCKIAIGTVEVMGTAHTMTAASYVFFFDKPWNFANVVQAEDRAHRIGSQSTVNCITLVCEGTIDERIEQIIFKKKELMTALIEGKKDVIQRLHVDFDDLLDELLS